MPMATLRAPAQLPLGLCFAMRALVTADLRLQLLAVAEVLSDDGGCARGGQGSAVRTTGGCRRSGQVAAGGFFMDAGPGT